MLWDPSADVSADPEVGTLAAGSAPPSAFWTFFVASLTILELILLIATPASSATLS